MVSEENSNFSYSRKNKTVLQLPMKALKFYQLRDKCLPTNVKGFSTIK
jgi:hypothetical protein